MNKQKTPSTPVIYKDFSLSFSKHPVTQDIVTVTNQEAIKRSLKHLILTSFYEVPFEPKIGSNIYDLLFSPVTPFTGIVMNNYIEEVIKNFEPRVNLIEVDTDINPDNNEATINITYSFQNIPANITFNLELDRAR